MEPDKILKIKDSIAVPLNRDQIMEKASLAAALVEEISKVEKDAKESSTEFKSLINNLKSKQQTFLRCVSTGKEFVTDAPCDQLFFLETNTVELWYDGKKVLSREMTPKEKALVSPNIFNLALKGTVVDPKPALPDDLSLPGMPDENDIRDVIRDETNRKKKKDLIK